MAACAGRFPATPFTGRNGRRGRQQGGRLPYSGDYSSGAGWRSRVTAPTSIAPAEGPTVIVMAHVLKRGCSNRSSCCPGQTPWRVNCPPSVDIVSANGSAAGWARILTTVSGRATSLPSVTRPLIEARGTSVPAVSDRSNHLFSNRPVSISWTSMLSQSVPGPWACVDENWMCLSSSMKSQSSSTKPSPKYLSGLPTVQTVRVVGTE